MIIIDKVSFNALIFIKPLLSLNKKIYYLIKDDDVFFDHKNLIQLEFNKKNSKGKNILKKWNIGDPKYFKKYTSLYFPKKSKINYEFLFKNIKNFRPKIINTFIGNLNFHQIGSINIHYMLYHFDKKIIILHTSIHSYMCKDNGSEFKYKPLHFYIPVDLIKLINCSIKFLLSKNILKNILVFNFISLRKILDPISNEEKSKSKTFINKKQTGIFIHHSLFYGRLYKKEHYFSEIKNSPLSKENLKIFINTNNFEGQSLFKNNFIKPNPKIKIKSIAKSIIFIFLNLFKSKTKEELYGLIYANFIYIKYIAWYEYFKDKNIANMIYDYDLLFSKPLSLALESLKIKTIALQERPITSWWNNYGVIVDTYLFGGKLFQEMGSKNECINFNHSFNFGMWRLSFFNDKNLIKLENSCFLSSSKLTPLDFRKKILFLGFFIDSIDNFPDTNKESFNDFLNYVIAVASKFKDSSVIIRMKSLELSDTDFIFKKIKQYKNIFLSNDYNNPKVSYRLCKEADVIISTTTSLAEESIAYGKKVIYINDLYPTNDMAREMYLKDFHFCIPKDINGALNLLKKCLDNNELIEKEYLELKLKLSGKIDLSDPKNIPHYLEKFLQ